MLNPKVADMIPYPRFEMVLHPKLHYKVGEDIVFYKNCVEHNIDVWVDTTLLNKHLTLMELNFQKTEEKE